MSKRIDDMDGLEYIEYLLDNTRQCQIEIKKYSDEAYTVTTDTTNDLHIFDCNTNERLGVEEK